MLKFYESIPFGVIILKGKPLSIEYFNNRAEKMLNLKKEILYKSFYILQFLRELSSVIINCFNKKQEEEITEVEIGENKFYSIIICGKEEQVEIYIQEKTKSVLENRKKIEDSMQRLDREKEKFLNISTELKTKCDIIEILRDREKKHLMHLRDVINNISEGILVVDSNGTISICNRAVYNIIQLDFGQLVSPAAIFNKYNVFNLQEDRLSMHYIYEKACKKNLPINNLIVKLVDKESLNTKYVEINSNPIFNRQQEVIYTIITLKDVTEAKLHQINAEEQAAFIKDVVNDLDVPIAVFNYPELTCKLINKKYKNIINTTDDEKALINEYHTIDINKVDNSYSYDKLNNIICNVGEKGKPFSLSPYSVLDENGIKRFYKVKFIPYKDNDNLVNRIHVYGLDITDEVNRNRELEEITKLKDEFFSVISHELRTPLTIIYSSLQLAYDIYKDEITDNIDKTLRRIDQNCSRLLKLINNILDISKAEAGFLTLNSSNFDIVYTTEFIISSVNLYAKSKGIQLIFDTNEEECIVLLDKDKYEKILLNLLSNSIKFTPEGKQVLVTLFVEDDYVTLSVKDEGIGIPEDKLDCIFDRFSQINTSLSRRAEGTGIGLSLVKKFVDYMNGSIKVISKEGEGSEFLVKFNKECLQKGKNLTIAAIDTTINDKINIEFSDIN
ncbi:PAS domain-containing sensor histidine kinase [Clostridium sp. SYSU_GA19001]|uniref:PAS domain-containing sensor histidine kinase n=1 Tax=Clostridium caldaquaticum TaxID=2940653 RepID=UPI002077906A|nr:PAS domain-containing sensor histidine kinase [Clostridium caldaquaticum]MCM8711726.1 PAS domain-containing sensor histidine kinase [Clostridium caldaquaticum]